MEFNQSESTGKPFTSSLAKLFSALPASFELPYFGFSLAKMSKNREEISCQNSDLGLDEMDKLVTKPWVENKQRATS